MEIKLLSGRCGWNKNENVSVTLVDSVDGTKFKFSSPNPNPHHKAQAPNVSVM